ncbi:MAG: RHS repeat-associated core domain-containing protein [Pirellulaceae bacterium]
MAGRLQELSLKLARRFRQNRNSQEPSIEGRHRKLRRRKLRAELLEDRRMLATITWDGGPTGSGTEWNSPENWNGDVVPGVLDDAVIGLDFASQTIQLSGQTVLRSVDSQATLRMSHSSGSLSLAADSSIRGLDHLAGTLTNAGVITIGQLWNWSGGSLTGGGTIQVGSEALVLFSGSNISLNGQAIDNSGSIDISLSSVGMGNRATFINRAGGIVTLDNDSNIGGGANESFINEGTLRKLSGNGTSQIDVSLESSGDIDIRSGTLRLGGQGEITGDTHLDQDTRLLLHGSYNFNLPADKSLSGSGILQANAFESTIQGLGEIDVPRVEVTGGTLLVERDLTVAEFVLSAGVYAGAATTTVTDVFDWGSGRFGDLRLNRGRVLVEATATASVTGSPLINNYSLENFTTMTMAINGLNIANASSIINHESGTIDLVNDGNWGGNANSTLFNRGTLRKSAGNGTSEFALRLESSGLIDIQSGVLRLNSEGEITGDVLIPEDSRLFLHGNYVFNLPADRVFTGPGVLQVNFGLNAIQGEGLIDLPTVEISGGTLLVERDLDTASLSVSAGSLEGSGTVTVNDHFEWSGGRLGLHTSGPGTLILPETATATLSGNTVALNNYRVENFGTIEFQISGGLNAGNNPTIHNHVGGLIDLKSNGSFGFSGQLTNEGTFRKSGGTGTNLVGMQFSNPGAIEVLTGAVQLTNALNNFTTAVPPSLDQGTWVVSSADPDVIEAGLRIDNAPLIEVNRGNITLDGNTSFRNQAGDNLLGALREIGSDGSLAIQNGTDLQLSTGDLINRGALIVGAASTLQIDGSFTQSTDATLSIGIGGDSGTGEVGHLDIGGEANLAGEFAPEFVNGYGPQAGESWQPITFASRVGDFSTVNVPLLGREPSLEVSANATDVTINALVSASDLQVMPTNIIFPGESLLGDAITIQYTVENLSETPAEGDWIDSIYLSKNNFIDKTDRLIARIPRNGGLAGNTSYTQSLEALLPALLEGPHRILVVTDSRGAIPDTNRNNNFASSAATIDITVPVLSVGSPITTTIAPGEQLYYRFDVAQDDVVVTAILAEEMQAEIFASHRTVPSRSDYQLVGETVGDAPLVQTLATTSTGPHYLLVHGGLAADGVQTLTLSAELAELQIYNVSNYFAYNIGQKTFTIRGSGFSPDMSLVVRSANDDVFVPKYLDVQSSTELVARFDFDGAELVQHDFVLGNGVSEVTAPLSMLGGGTPGQLDYSTEYPERIRVLGKGSFTLRYVNSGDTDVGVPILSLKQVKGDETPLMPIPPNLNLDYDPVQDGNLRLEILNVEGAKAGVIPPGTEARIEFQFRTLQGTPSPDTIDYEVHSPLANLDEPLRYSNLLSERPERITQAAWEVVVGNLRDILGEHEVDMQEAIAQSLAYLETIGDTDVSVDDLMAFWFAQANDALPGGVLSAAVDISLPSNGLGLSFGRSYGRPIAERFDIGILGYGWTHNYDLTLRKVDEEFVAKDDDPLDWYYNAISPKARFELTTPTGIRIFEGHGTRNILAPQVFVEDQTGAQVTDGASVVEEADGTQLFFSGPETTTGRRLSAVRDPFGNLLTLKYELDRLTQIRHSDGSQLDFEYDAAGLLIRLIASTGEEVVYGYDSSGEHLTAVTRSVGTVNYAYDTGSISTKQHALTSVTNIQGTTTNFAYNDAGRLAQVQTVGAGEGLIFQYRGGEVLTSNSEGTATFFFDSKGRVARAVDPLGTVTAQGFSRTLGQRGVHTGFQTLEAATSAQVAGVDLYEQRTIPGKNGFTSVTNAAGDSVYFTYQTTGNDFLPSDKRLVRITDELERVTKFGYDEGRLESITYPDGAQERFTTFDDHGQAQTYINRRNESFNSQFNESGQLTRQVLPDGTVQEFTYDMRGNLLTASDESGTTSFAYDSADRLLRVAYPNGRSIDYTYNAVGQLTRVEDQDGVATQYAYDIAGRLQTVFDTAGDLVVGYSYDNVGRLSREDHGNGTYTTYEYDLASQLVGLLNHAPDDSLNSSYIYSYNGLGQRESMETLAGTWTYSYDAIGQLIEADFASIDSSIPNQELEFHYDAAGNRIRTVRNGEVTDYGVNNRNQYTVVGSAVYSYDAEGNLVSIEDGGETTTYEYDVLNRLVAVHTPTGTTTYEYDLFGNRVAMVENGERVEFLVDPFGNSVVLSEYDASGELITAYTHGQGLVARTDTGGGLSFYDYDANGSTSGLSNNAGAYINAYAYTPFGQNLVEIEAIDNRFEFVGQFGVERDGTALHRMGARFYDSLSGRFTTEDPIRHNGGINLYEYANSDPIQFVDPAGTSAFLTRLGSGARARIFNLVFRTIALTEGKGIPKPPVSTIALAEAQKSERVKRLLKGGSVVGTIAVGLTAGNANASTGSVEELQYFDLFAEFAALAVAEWLSEKINPFGTPDEFYDELKFNYQFMLGPGAYGRSNSFLCVTRL